jgi:hypothetical protein
MRRITAKEIIMTNRIQYSKKFPDGTIVVVGGDNIKEFNKNYTDFRASDVAKTIFQEASAPPVAAPQPSTVGITPPQADPSWCQIHNVQMKQYEKDGRKWFSHKVGEGWCKGK